jgi:putative glutamine amidotransferase
MPTFRGGTIVAILCNLSSTEGRLSHRTGHNYITAVRDGSLATPLLVPALEEISDVEALLSRVDGVVLTGGASNIEPHHYDGDPAIDVGENDPGRDAMAFALVKTALSAGIPLFGICRGIQEMNVALGGSLIPWLHEAPGRFDHRRPREKPMEYQLSPRQRITLSEGGMLQQLAGGASQAMVNTLHGQGIDRLADGLFVEAVADDGTIEAVRVEGAESFALGVQWHPEWRAMEHPLYAALFRAFGDAVRQYAARHPGAGTNAAAPSQAAD